MKSFKNKTCCRCKEPATLHDGINDHFYCPKHFHEKMKELGKPGRPRKGDGRRVHISGRVDEYVLKEIHSKMTSQEFIDYAAEKFINEKSPIKKPPKKGA